MANARALALSWGPPVVASIFLALFARSFDFVCDDAYLALRQADNLAHHGAPVYNLGERVEVATSPVWSWILALGLLVRIPPVALLQLTSVASGVALVFATWALVQRLLPNAKGGQLFAIATLVTAAPVAAWSIGGLETALFAACVTWTFARIETFRDDPSPREAARLGVVLALTCLVRLEGALLLVIAPIVLRKAGLKLVLRAVAIAVAPLVLLTLFRLAYYHLPLPHTFYAKTAGDPRARLQRGLDYLYFCTVEIGFFLSVLLAISPFLAKSSAATWTARLFVPLYVAYVVLIGGDFLDLYRFFVPIFPLLFVTFTAVVVGLFNRYGAAPTTRIAVGVLALLPHGIREVGLANRALSVREAQRAALAIEPLGWTKRAAIEWSNIGSWLKSVARPGDTLATGAAGAMPFYSGLENFDLFGLGAPEVARAGVALGIRPGHSRFATVEQIEKHAPAFMAIEVLPKDRASWEKRGYVWIKVRSDGFVTPLLVRRDRSADVLARPEVEPWPSAKE